MYRQPMHFSHERRLYMQITRSLVNINRDSAMTIHCWHGVSNLWHSNPDLLCFAAAPSFWELAIFIYILPTKFVVASCNTALSLFGFSIQLKTVQQPNIESRILLLVPFKMISKPNTTLLQWLSVSSGSLILKLSSSSRLVHSRVEY